MTMEKFQSTRPRGTRRRPGMPQQSRNSFNPRVREGRDRDMCIQARDSTRFNPRVREGRDSSILSTRSSPETFQSTRPRGTRRDRLLHPLDMPPVSIHASARDATQYWPPVCASLMFQSTRPRGTRRRASCGSAGAQVSIHAAARSATRRLSVSASRRSGFNPRVREGRDNS